MSGTGTADRTAEEEHGDLRRSLGFRDLVVYGLLFIAPMALLIGLGVLLAQRGRQLRTRLRRCRTLHAGVVAGSRTGAPGRARVLIAQCATA
jgi:hypothetical protein